MTIKKLILVAFFAVMGVFMSGCEKEDVILNFVSLDDAGYVLENIDDTYIVKLPEGRPRVPQIICEGGEVVQAFFADSENEAVAKVTLPQVPELEDEPKNIEIKFIEVPEMGFELQYDDRYKFEPSFAATAFKSSDESIATVDSHGNIIIKGISELGVTITAYNGEETEELVITRTIKAPLSVYAITGQSNAAYYYVEPEKAVVTLPGTSYHYAKLSEQPIRDMNNIDGTMAVGNIEPGMAKVLYDLLGEKTLILNIGLSGRKISTFEPYDSESYLEIAGMMADVQKAIDEANLSENFELKIRSYCWSQGESEYTTLSDEYKVSFLQFHDEFTSDNYGFEYAFLVKCRPEYPGAMEGQEELALEEDDVIMGTRATEWFSVENGMMKEDNLHYSQEGDNVLGEELGESIVAVYLGKMQ